MSFTRCQARVWHEIHEVLPYISHNYPMVLHIGCSQGLLLALDLGITPGMLRKQVVLGIEPMSAICKKRAP